MVLKAANIQRRRRQKTGTRKVVLTKMRLKTRRSRKGCTKKVFFFSCCDMKNHLSELVKLKIRYDDSIVI